MLRWLWLSVVVVVLDQLTKQWVSGALTLQQPMEILPVFNLTLMHNTGAAFSFLHNASGWQRWFFTLLALGVSVAIVVWLRRMRTHERWLGVALTLILGGAVGNVSDRIRIGYVVDFIQVHYQDWYYPAFNVADSAITIGAIMLVIDSLRRRPKTGE